MLKTKPQMKIIIFLLLFFPFFTNGQQFDIADGEKIIFHNYFGDYYIFKNTKKNTFFITDENEKTVIKNLKYCEPLSMDFIQAIDKKNRIIYFDTNLNIVEYPKPLSLLVCGTVDYYNIKLIKKDNQYLVETTTNRTFTGGENTTEITATIEDEGFDKIYFINKEQTLSFQGSYPYTPTYLFFEKDNKFGIIDKDNISLYDTIVISETMFRKILKIGKSGFYNYYHISEKVKYKRLNDFVFNLAYFELENGKKGYVDLDGNEYYL